MAGKTKININLARDFAMKKAQKGVRAATLECKRIVQVDILSSFPPRTGRRYKRGKDLWHIASAPGESPAPDRGQLRATIGTSFEVMQGSMTARGVVYSNLAYGATLETGDDKRAPRPWISRLLGSEFRARIMRAFAKGAGV